MVMSLDPIPAISKEFEGNAHLEALNKREKFTVFRSIIKGEAATWIGTLEADCYVALRNEFLMKRWNPKIQRKKVDHILDGRFENTSGGRLKTYFRKWKSLARSLEQQR